MFSCITPDIQNPTKHKKALINKKSHPFETASFSFPTVTPGNKIRTFVVSSRRDVIQVGNQRDIAICSAGAKQNYNDCSLLEIQKHTYHIFQSISFCSFRKVDLCRPWVSSVTLLLTTWFKRPAFMAGYCFMASRTQ